MSALRCLGWTAPCVRPVDPIVGGAWCTAHRPADLTGALWDAARLLETRTADHRVRRVPRVRRARGVA